MKITRLYLLQTLLLAYCMVFPLSATELVSIEVDVRGSHEKGNPLKFEKKYYLKDCVVKLALLWEINETWEHKYAVMDNIQQQMAVALNHAIAGNIPLFFDSYTREASHIAIYFPDRCEDRVSMTNKLIQDYLNNCS